jgi:hypothetical protein
VVSDLNACKLMNLKLTTTLDLSQKARVVRIHEGLEEGSDSMESRTDRNHVWREYRSCTFTTRVQRRTDRVDVLTCG